MKVLLFFAGLVLLLAVPVAQAQQLYQREVQYEFMLKTNDAAPCPDGGIVTLCDNSVIVKFGADGEVQWSKQFSGGAKLSISTISVMKDGAILCGGSFYTKDQHAIIIKLDRFGQPLWDSSYDLGAGINTEPSTQIFTRDGNMLIGMATGNSATVLLKIDSNGLPLWKRLDGIRTTGSRTAISALVEKADGSIIALVETPDGDRSVTGSPIILAYYSRGGKLRSTQTYESPGLSFHPSVLALQNDGSLLIGGSVVDSGFSPLQFMPILVKVDSSFKPIYSSKTSFLSRSETVRSIIPQADGSIVMITTSVPSFLTVNEPCHIAFYNASGEPTSIKEYSLGPWALRSLYLAPRNEGGYVGIGMVALDSSAIRLSSFTLTNDFTGCLSHLSLSSFTSITLSQVDTLIDMYDDLPPTPVTGNFTLKDIKPVSSALVCGTSDVAATVIEAQPLLVYPNPVRSRQECSVVAPQELKGEYRLCLRDAAGRQIYTTNTTTHPGDHLHVPTDGLASGIYCVELAEPSSFATIWRTKLVIQ